MAVPEQAAIMKAFLGKHRAAIRGAFLINLDCVGAGNLSALSREGLLNVRRADRRLMGLPGLSQPLGSRGHLSPLARDSRDLARLGR